MAALPLLAACSGDGASNASDPPPTDTIAPTVSLTAPAAGNVVGSVTVSASASDNVSVVGVQFQVDGQNLSTEDTNSPYSIVWNTANASVGAHSLTAIARDAAGNRTTSRAVQVTVQAVPPSPADTTPPTVSMATPTGGNVYGNVTVSASASDNVGVAGVQFRLNGQNLGAEDTTAPYHVSWDTTSMTPGSVHTLTAVARDAAGNSATSAPVQVTVQAPPTDSLTQGFDAPNQRVTSSTVVLDLARPAAGNYPAWVSRMPYAGMVRDATHEVLPGGFFGRGFSRFSPGNVIDNNRGEHYCGVGQIHGFSNVGDSSRMVVGQLVRFGTTFFADMASVNAVYGDIKDIVLINDSCQTSTPNCRPMMNTKGSDARVGATRVMGACQGTVCNTTNDPNVIDYFNEGGHQPDIDRYRGQWLWIEFQFNSNVPRTRTRVWSADGVFQGAEIVAPWASPGSVTTLDIIGFVNSIPTPGAQPYYDLERVEFRVGTDGNITPPAGFPGSARQ